MSAFATFKFRGNTFEYEGRIYPFENNRAFASITLNHVISIKCHVIEGQYGHFISWPSYKSGDEYKNFIYVAPELKDELSELIAKMINALKDMQSEEDEKMIDMQEKVESLKDEMPF